MNLNWLKVYEKLKPGIWGYDGIFRLIDVWQEISNARKVFKFKLELIDDAGSTTDVVTHDIDHNRQAVQKMGPPQRIELVSLNVIME